MDSKALDGKIAIVTGGSSGIGAECARQLAAQGATVVVGYNRGQERAEEVVHKLPGAGHMAEFMPLEDEAAHEALADKVKQLFGQVHILVNSAGHTQRIPHADTATLTPVLFNAILSANVGGPWSVTRALLPLLKKSGDGLVVNISSVSAFTGSGSNIAYCAAKAALDTMTMSLARVMGPEVRLICVSPASVDTGFVEGRSREELERKAGQTPLGRVVTPEDVALAVLGCATHLRTATGTRLIIDGGHSL